MNRSTCALWTASVHKWQGKDVLIDFVYTAVNPDIVEIFASTDLNIVKVGGGDFQRRQIRLRKVSVVCKAFLLPHALSDLFAFIPEPGFLDYLAPTALLNQSHLHLEETFDTNVPSHGHSPPRMAYLQPTGTSSVNVQSSEYCLLQPVTHTLRRDLRCEFTMQWIMY